MIVKGREVKVNMQRRHLELIASVVDSIPADIKVSRDCVATMFAAALAREQVNEHFDVSRFVAACTTGAKCTG